MRPSSSKQQSAQSAKSIAHVFGENMQIFFNRQQQSSRDCCWSAVSPSEANVITSSILLQILLLIFVLCEAPTILAFCIHSFSGSWIGTDVKMHAVFFSNCLLSVDSMANFFIYCNNCSSFRYTLRRHCSYRRRSLFSCKRSEIH